MKRIRHTGMQAARLACLMLIIGIIFGMMPSTAASADEKLGNYEAHHYVSTGGTPVDTPDSPDSVVNEFNKFLMSLLRIAGIVVIVLGVIKLIMSLTDHAPMSKLNSTTMISLGLVMVGGSTVLDALTSLSSTASEKERVQPILDMIGEGFLWPGIILAAIGVFKCVLSIMNERPEEKVEGGKMAFIGAILASSSVAITAISDFVFAGTDSTTTATNIGNYIINDIIVPVAMLIGGVIVAFGLFNFAQSFKDEDSSGKSRASIQLVVGLLMVSAGTVVKIFISSTGTTSPKDIMTTITTITKYASVVLGGIMLLVGSLQFGAAYKDDNSEAKTRASHVIVTGIILLAIGGIIATIVEGMLF